MKKRLEIKKDVLNIAQRMKKIDRNYSVCFNFFSRVFEVWHKGRLSFTVGKTLDNSALKKSLISNASNAKKLFRDMKENNEKLEMKAKFDLESKNKALLSSLLSYADKKSADCDFAGINRTKWF